MIKLPDRKDLIEISFRTINDEYYLRIPNSREFLDKLDLKQFDGVDWVKHNINSPRIGDLYPGFIRSAIGLFLEKMGWQIKEVGKITIGIQERLGKDTYAFYTNFVGIDANHIREKVLKAEQKAKQIKNRKQKEKQKRKRK